MKLTEAKGKQKCIVCFRAFALVMFANHHSRITKQIQEANANTTNIRLNMLGFCLEIFYDREWGKEPENTEIAVGPCCRSYPTE